MWALLCPIKTGTPVSRLDACIPALDTGTQADETGRDVTGVIRCVWEKALDWGVQRMSKPYGVSASVLRWSRKVNIRSRYA